MLLWINVVVGQHQHAAADMHGVRKAEDPLRMLCVSPLFCLVYTFILFGLYECTVCSIQV